MLNTTMLPTSRIPRRLSGSSAGGCVMCGVRGVLGEQSSSRVVVISSPQSLHTSATIAPDKVEQVSSSCCGNFTVLGKDPY